MGEETGLHVGRRRLLRHGAKQVVAAAAAEAYASQMTEGKEVVSESRGFGPPNQFKGLVS